MPDWRYTEWATYTAQPTVARVKWTGGAAAGVELYDHSSGSLNDFDAHENENLGKPQYQALQAALSQQLRAMSQIRPGRTMYSTPMCVVQLHRTYWNHKNDLPY